MTSPRGPEPATEPAPVVPGSVAPGSVAPGSVAPAEVTVPRGFPGWALRVVLAAAGGGLLAAALAGGHGTALTTVAGIAMFVLVVATATAPGSPAPLVLLLAVVGLRVVGGTSGPDAHLMVLVALIPLVHQLSGIAAAIPARATVEPAALVPAVLRYLAAVVPIEIVVLVWQ